MRPGGSRRPAPPNPLLSAAMAGAVDLAAVKARNEAAARAAEAPAPGAGQYVVDVTEANFQPEILDRSFQVPVLLVVTSARSAASTELADTLETVVNGGKGAIVLGKVDADAEPQLVQALQVRAVPTVHAVIGGQLVPGFEGALPDDQLREFIGAVLQAAAQAGLKGPGMPADESGEADEPAQPEDPRFDAAEEALADGNYDLAKERFQAIVDAEPGNAAAANALRQVDLLRRISSYDVASDPPADDVAAQLAAADLAFAADDAEGALRRLLDLLARCAGDDRDSVRERLIEYFDLLGPDDPRVAPARREMARALF